MTKWKHAKLLIYKNYQRYL